MDAIATGSLTIVNARIPDPGSSVPGALRTIECKSGLICWIDEQDGFVQVDAQAGAGQVDAKGGLVIPSLCHSHIHLDKCYILDRCNLVSGDFAEAMTVTNEAKAGFDEVDLYTRGFNLIRDSVECGVTSMRAHVEIDTVVKFTCLDVGRKLCKTFDGISFAQEPLFDGSSEEPGENYSLLQEAAALGTLSVVGSAPYVEPSLAQAKLNIKLILELAQKHECHVDFHLDYNLDPTSEPLIYEVIAQAKRLFWPTGRRITIGHATRLQLLTSDEWCNLKQAIGELPITFIGLPQSDLYMLGRGAVDEPLGPPRGTLRVPYLANKHQIQVALSVNNVQNAFTPQGSVDPLSLCTLGVALFQTATAPDLINLLVRALFGKKSELKNEQRAVTTISKRAIADPNATADISVAIDDPAHLVVLHDSPTLQAAVLNPGFDRTTIRAGVVVAHRESVKWVKTSVD
ncbi:unnamed protein product [Mycena citricolor]|uniref:Metallo-dependent hydrolase n=1 Tax=Mycena citricolor TaxID=2018698 RepID=A0AAD2HI77_9AGAR|nr:unnamed protein product [Mycena citricolor]CAK5275464.1 unnamed protein product [Mycena citricolor]